MIKHKSKILPSSLSSSTLTSFSLSTLLLLPLSLVLALYHGSLLADFEESTTEWGDEAKSSFQKFSNERQHTRTGGEFGTYAPLGLILDRYLSPIAGASLFSSVVYGYQAFDDCLLPSTLGDTRVSMVAARVGKALLEGLLLFDTITVAQHEYFGHGARLREFHIHDVDYFISPWRGSTSYPLAAFNALAPSKRIAMLAGGMEATNIFAKYLRDNWLETSCMDERVGHMYLISSLSQTFYVLGTRRERNIYRQNQLTGHDIFGYIVEVNNWFGREVINDDKLRRRIYIDFLDPFFFYSVYGLAKYFYDGTQAFEYPMFCMGEYRYLPGFRTAFAPYGPEYQFLNFIKTPDNQTIQATLRYGNTGGKHSTGIILEIIRLFSSDLLNFDGRLDLFHQPKLFTATASQAKSKTGGMLALKARYLFTNCIEGMVQLGYKSTGYIPGEVLKSSPIVRVGMLLKI